jgi:hypothetical protein
MKGVFDFKVGGQDRGFKFGTYAFAIACDREKCSMDQLLDRIGINEGKKANLLSLLNLFYGAAVHYAEHKKTPIDFGPSDVSDWLDEVGLTETMKMISEGLQQYVPKNSNSLQENRETVTQ